MTKNTKNNKNYKNYKNYKILQKITKNYKNDKNYKKDKNYKQTNRQKNKKNKKTNKQRDIQIKKQRDRESGPATKYFSISGFHYFLLLNNLVQNARYNTTFFQIIQINIQPEFSRI